MRTSAGYDNGQRQDPRTDMNMARVYFDDSEVDLDRHLVHIDNTSLTIRRAFDQLVIATQEEKEKYRHLCSITEKDLRVTLGGKLAHHRSRAENVLAEIAKESDVAVRGYEKEIHEVNGCDYDDDDDDDDDDFCCDHT